MKTGRLSKQELNFIERNADRMVPEDIANKLDRDIQPILRHLRKIGKSLNKKEDFETQAEFDLKSKAYWPELKNQFSDTELNLFMYHWKEIITQFQRDVLPTEELQILDLIKIMILMDRALREQRESQIKVAEFEKELEKEKRKTGSDKDMEQIFSLERQVAVMRAAKESLSKDFKELQSKKSTLNKELKANRDQRVDKIESHKETFNSLIRRLTKDPKFCEEQSIAMEKMRLAIEKEKERLGAYHVFDDGEIDRPFLSDETVTEEG